MWLSTLYISFLEAITTSTPCKHPSSYLSRPSRENREILLQRQVKHVESEDKGIPGSSTWWREMDTGSSNKVFA